jgi:hypothetical protein
MRMEIFPFLRRVFGKEVDQTLCSIAKEAQELTEYSDATN